MEQAEVIAVENSWKERLHAREPFGDGGERVSMAMFPPSQTRAMWPVIVVSMAVTLVASELALGAIRNHQDEVSDRLYVMVFAAASLSALVVCF